MEDHNVLQEAGHKIILKKKKKARRQSRYLRRLKKEGKQKNKGDKGKLYLTKCRFPKNNTERQ